MITRWPGEGILWRPDARIRSLGIAGWAGSAGGLRGGSVARVTVPVMSKRYVIAASLALGLMTGAGGLVGCQSGQAEVDNGGACSSDADCVGAICYQGRFCVQTSPEQSEVVLSIRPKVESGLVLEQFLTTVGGAEHDLERKWSLTPAAVVHGTVSRGGFPPTGSVPGFVVATSAGVLPGTLLSYETNSYSSRKFTEPAPKGDPEATEKTYGFELLAQPGRAYDVRFWPQIDDIPPFYTERFVGGGDDVWLVELPNEAKLVVVRGRIVSGQGGQPDCAGSSTVLTCAAGCGGISGLEVRLVDEEGRLRSTRAITGAKGEFQIHADPAAAKVWLKFRPEDVDLTLPHGAVAAPIDLATMQFKDVTEHDLGLVHLGDLPAPSALVEVRPHVVDEAEQPVVGARVTLRQDRPSSSRCVEQGGELKAVPLLSALFYSRSGLTNAAGMVKIARKDTSLAGGAEVVYDEVMAMPPKGQILATILPPALAPSSSRQVKIEGGDKEPQMKCLPRPVVRGAVTDFRGRPIVAATVLFKPLLASKPDCPAAQPADFPRPEASIVVQADENGVYSAHLDPGRFAVLVNPPKGSGLARALIKVIDLCALGPAVTDPIAVATVLDLTVPPPTLLRGRIHGPGGQPVVGAVVDVLASELTKLPGQGEAGHGKPPLNLVTKAQMVFDTQVLGSAMTDGDGRYEVLVAAGQLAAKD